MLRDATVASLLEALVKNGIPHEVNRAENYLVMGETRSKILFRAVEEFERLRGSNLAWFGLDELTYTSEGAWLRLEGRLRDPKAARLCGFAVWTPKGYDWVYERFVAERVDGYEVVTAKAFENRHLLEQIPDYYERLKSSYDTRFYQQEVLGEYLHLHAGRVYYGFEREKNVAEVKVDRKRALLWALDFNVDPMSSVIAQMGGDGVLVLDEIVLSRATTQQACEEFQNRFPEHSAGLKVYADASGAHMQTTGNSDLGVLKKFFRSGEYGSVEFKVPRSNPAVRDRVQMVNAALQPADGDARAADSRLKISARCKELIKDLEQVAYKENTQVIDKDRDPRRTHLSDALGYLVWQELRVREKAGERGTRLI
jgi:hypothetical protein